MIKQTLGFSRIISGKLQTITCCPRPPVPAGAAGLLRLPSGEGASGVRATAAFRLLLQVALLTTHWHPRYSRCPPCAHTCAWLCARRVSTCVPGCVPAHVTARVSAHVPARVPSRVPALVPSPRASPLPVCLHARPSQSFCTHLGGGATSWRASPQPTSCPAPAPHPPPSGGCCSRVWVGVAPQAPTPAVGTGGPGAQGPASLSP